VPGRITRYRWPGASRRGRGVSRPLRDGGLEGSWRVLSASGRSDGTEIPNDLFDDTVIAFADGKMTMSGRNERTHTRRYTTNPATDPPSIDLEDIAPGRGGKQLGIYEIKGENMKLCMSESRRPTSFGMKGADNWLLLNLRRKGP
jgi:uncharacterized protein (TIGR03067 family)